MLVAGLWLSCCESKGEAWGFFFSFAVQFDRLKNKHLIGRLYRVVSVDHIANYFRKCAGQ